MSLLVPALAVGVTTDRHSPRAMLGVQEGAVA
jgi:hypothetical protein